MKHFFTLFCAVLFFAAFTNLTAQINWTKHSDPVLTPGPAGEWDEEFVGMPCVLFNGSTYHMWYGNYNHITVKFEKIGYATSSDGIMWTKYDNPATTNPPYAKSDPVLLPGSPGTYDDEGVSSPSVLLIDNTYHMWYGASDDPAFSGHNSICYATSINGITWNKDLNNPVLDVGPNGTWDDVWVYEPCVVFDGSIYHMWYCAWNGISPPERVRIGHATSPDPGGPWTKDPDNPVLNIGSSLSWDYDRVDAPGVVFDGERFHMFYSGGMFAAWRIGYAWLDNGSNWTKHDDPTTTNHPYAESDPVLTWGPAGTFDDINVSHCSVILDSTQDQDSLKMWYLAGDSVYGNHYSCQIGYATAAFIDTPTAIEEYENIRILNGYSLKQNYPNPFNPTTKIVFSIPKSEFVTLKVYNILGEEVVTLVNKKQPAGSYEVEWDASGFASGVYYCQLKAGDFKHVKKMVLIK
jgi:predicted GH43/DUF377 family glycosyl hydrolase